MRSKGQNSKSKRMAPRPWGASTDPRAARADVASLQGEASRDREARRVQPGPVDHRAQRSQEHPGTRPGAAKGPAPNLGSRAKTPRALQTCPAAAGDRRSSYTRYEFSPTEWASCPIREQLVTCRGCLPPLHRSAVRPRGESPQSICVSVLKEYFKSEKLIKLENRVKETIIEALKKLDKLIQEARIHQEWLLQDSRRLQEERVRVEAENNSFLKYLSKKNDQCREKHEKLWKKYFHKCDGLALKRQALACLYAQRAADLQAQLLQGRKTQSDLKQQIQAMSHIYLVKERQERKVQMLLKEKENARAEAAAKNREAHLQFLQQKALLDREMSELNMLRLRGSNTGKLNSKAEALKLTAKKAHSDFCHRVSRENWELRKELQQLSQEYHKLEAIKLQLEMQVQQLKEEQWYVEALIRGRQQLREEEYGGLVITAQKNRGSKGHTEPTHRSQIKNNPK